MKAGPAGPPFLFPRFKQASTTEAKLCVHRMVWVQGRRGGCGGRRPLKSPRGCRPPHPPTVNILSTPFRVCVPQIRRFGEREISVSAPGPASAPMLGRGHQKGFRGMTGLSFSQRIQERLTLLLLAALSFLCVSCSTPTVPNSGFDEGTAYWAYQQCMANQAQYGNQRACNMIGVTNGVSYTDWTYGSNLYVNDHQPTDSAFQGRFYKAAQASSYETYVNALPVTVQDEMRMKWLELAHVDSARESD